MKKSVFTIFPMFFSIVLMAQNVMSIHYKNGNNLNVPISKIDSVTLVDFSEIEENAVWNTSTEALVKTRIIMPKVDFKARAEFRVLAIGNSFLYDATAYLPDFIKAANIDVSDLAIMKLARGGGSFKTFYDSWHNNDNRNDIIGCHYTTSRIAGKLSCPIIGESNYEKMHNMIEINKFDLIMIQNLCQDYEYTSWSKHGDDGYLTEMLRILRFYQPQAAIGYMMPHASHAKDNDTKRLWERLTKCAKFLMSEYGIDFVIPVATAIENLRVSSLNNASIKRGFSRDDHHIGYGLGRYVEAAVYFQSLIAPRYGISVYGNSYIHPITPSEQQASDYKYPDECVDVTSANARLAQMCAVLACDDMFTITGPDGIIETVISSK